MTVADSHLQVHDGRARCTPTSAPADVPMDLDVLGSLYLGSHIASSFASANRLHWNGSGCWRALTRRSSAMSPLYSDTASSQRSQSACNQGLQALCDVGEAQPDSLWNGARMDRRSFAAAITLGSAAALFGAQRASAAPPTDAMPRARNVVLVHGAYADGSCWSDVIPYLQARGLNVASVQNPLRTLDEDCEFARRTLALMDGPTVLAAHSYSGMIATEVGVDPKVTALVYIAARAPDAGEDYTALAAQYPTPPASAGLVQERRRIRAAVRVGLPQRFRARCRPCPGQGVVRGAGQDLGRVVQRPHHAGCLARQADVLRGLEEATARSIQTSSGSWPTE